MISWLRLFAVQASWNYDRMAAVGTARALEPMLRDLPGGVGGPRYNDAVRRSVGFFNAHPYLIGVAVGAIARAEHDGIPGQQIERMKTALTSSLGSMGDRLVWAGALPFASGIGLALAATMRGRTNVGCVSGRKKAPVTQPCAYELWPKKGTPRLMPVRYSRSADRPRKITSIPSTRIRSESRARRSA